MKEGKQLLVDFLNKRVSCPERALKLFEDYLEYLLQANRRINLISRKLTTDEIWTFHFYDSLLPFWYGIDFRCKKVLDLGTGGGLPGIPLAIVEEEMTMHLLDSRLKKMEEVDKIIKKLDLINCHAICSRMEELAGNPIVNEDIETTNYDIIVCRSVAMTGPLLRKIMSLMTEEGFLLLYKAKTLEEVIKQMDITVYDYKDFPGRERKLIKIKKQKVKL